jgi:lipoprotein-anchoring transpeptidase ErfK/SrfK
MSNGNQPTGQITPEMQDQLKQMSDIYTNYQLTDDDFKRLGKAPQRPSQQAKMKQMPYRSITDFVAERFHSGEEFIQKLNAGRNMSALKPGDNLRVPNVQPFRIETFKRADDLPISQALAGRVIKVDTHDRVLDVIDGDKIIGSYPITPGSKTLPAPLGTWKVVRITMLPWFRWDEAMLRHGRRSGDFFNIPPGPRNPVGIAWIGLNKKGVGIHGTDHPDMIGRSASHGCIRLANWDAARVANQVTDGTTVEIF